MHNRDTVAQQQIDQLLEALQKLLAVPELLYFEDLFDETHEAISQANVVCRGVRDELAEFEGRL